MIKESMLKLPKIGDVTYLIAIFSWLDRIKRFPKAIAFILLSDWSRISIKDRNKLAESQY